MSKKIGIAFVIDTINSIGGTEKQLLSLMSLLDENRFDKHLVCLKPPDAYVHFSTGNREDYSTHFNYHQCDIQSLMSTECAGRTIKLAKFFKENRIDIVQTYFVDAQIIGVAAGKLAGVKHIVCCRRDLGFWHNRQLVIIIRALNRFVDHFLVNSHAVKQQVARDEWVHPDKISVIYNGIDKSRFNGNSSPRNDTVDLFDRQKNYCIGISANFSRRVKRVDVFIRAAAEVLKAIPNVFFCIVGEGYLKQELAELSDASHMSERILFLGAVKDIPNCIKHWDIGVLSSESEGLSNSILKYMATGMPVVATAVGGNKELIRDGVNGFLVPNEDYQSMADKLCRLLKDPHLRKNMGESGKRMISERFGWEKVIRDYEAYYDSLLGSDL